MSLTLELVAAVHIRLFHMKKQLDMKLSQVKKLIVDAIGTEDEAGYKFLGIKGSPQNKEYRNKMEFSFGDEYKDGPLALGMHKRGSFMIL